MLLHAHGLAPKGVTGARNSRVSAASRPPGAAPAVRIHANLPNGRRLTLRSTAASEQEASQAHQQDTAQVAPAVQVQGPWSDEQRDALWEAVPRALIKLGKAGAQESHVRSLQDMLRAHTLVKVQLNAQPLGIAELAPQLAAQSEATLVAVRGRTILLAQGDAEPSRVTEHAKEQLGKIRKYHEKRKNRFLEPEDVDPAGGEFQGRTQGGPSPAQGFGRGAPRSANPLGRSSAGRGAASRAAGSGAVQGPSIDQLIAASSSKGELNKETLQKEWMSLADEIRKQEEAEFGARRGRPGQASSAAATARQRASKAPWRRREGS